MCREPAEINGTGSGWEGEEKWKGRKEKREGEMEGRERE